MHIFISGIGGSGMSGIANLALDMGFEVSGSDLHPSLTTESLIFRKAKISFEQSLENIKKIHNKNPINWFIHTSSINNLHSEFIFCQNQKIKISKRDDFLNYLIKAKNLQLVAIAGTHGKTTTTSMMVWTFKQLKIPVSYLIGTGLSWGRNAEYHPSSKYFVLETDEFDRNFLSYTPACIIITSLEYDHPDTYLSSEDYFQAFNKFLNKIQRNIFIYDSDLKQTNLRKDNIFIKTKTQKEIQEIQIPGVHNRQNAFLVREFFRQILKIETLKILNKFPGSQRRFEKLAKNIYTDYAHHPTEIKATLQLASELVSEIIVIYQPHQNIRQHEIKEQYAKVFYLAKKVYWLPTYLTRENPNLEIISPKDLSKFSKHPSVIQADLDKDLIKNLQLELKKNQTLIFMGAGTIDNWLRKNLDQINQ